MDQVPDGGKTSRLPFFYGWVIVAAGLTVWTVEPALITSFGVFLKPVAAEMGWNRAMVSVAFSLAGLMLALFSPVSGVLCDRYGPRVLIVASGLLVGTSSALLSTVKELWQFWAFYLLIGVSLGISLAPISATTARWFEEKRGLALGFASVGTGVGGMIFPPLSNHLISLWGWRSTYLFLGILLGVLVVASGILMRRNPQQMGLLPYGARAGKPAAGAEARVRPTHPAYSLGLAVRTRALWGIMLAIFASVFTFNMTSGHLVPYASDVGLSAALAALVMGVVGAGNSAGRVGLGALSDRIGRKRILTAALFVEGAAILWLTVAQSPWTLFLFAVVFGLAYGGAYVCCITLPGDWFGLPSVGATAGFIFLSANIGGAISPFLAGYIVDSTQSYSAAFLLAAGLFMVSGLFLLLTRAPGKTNH